MSEKAKKMVKAQGLPLELNKVILFFKFNINELFELVFISKRPQNLNSKMNI